MITPTNNYIFVVLEKEREDTISLGGKEIYFDGNYDKERNKRLYGEVIGVPQKLVLTEFLYEILPGEPAYKEYVSGETLLQQENHGVSVSRDDYCCSVGSKQYAKITDIVMDVRVGDRIYVHFNSLVPHNHIKNHDGRTIYKVPYSSVICAIRNQEIMPIGGYVLVEPSFDEGVEDIGGGSKGKLSASGLVTEIVTAPKYLEGIVRHVGSPLKCEEEIVKPGDKIIYEKNADWLMKIEGKEYFVIRQRDLLAVIEDEKRV